MLDIDKTILLKSLKTIRNNLDNLINLIEPPPTPMSELFDTHFQWLIPYLNYTGIQYSRKFYQYFKNNGFNRRTISKCKFITQSIIDSVGVLCCPLPYDPIIGFSNSISFHPYCVRDLVSFIIDKYPEARFDYLNLFKEAEAEMSLSRFAISAKAVKSQHFDLLSYDKFNRYALNFIFWKWHKGLYDSPSV